MSSNLPAVRGDAVPVSYDEAIRVGEVMAQSGFFDGAKQVAQAAVKVIAGQELGIGPVAAMTGIHLVQGKVTLSANLIAGQIKRSGRYDYRARIEDEVVEVVFFEHGDEIGRSKFDKADAQAAGLWGKAGPWKQHPRNMLFARAMSNGAKWFCPDVFAGPVYTPDELGATVDGETGEVIDLPAAPAPAPVDPAMQVARDRYRALRDEFGNGALTAALVEMKVEGTALADDEVFRLATGEARRLAAADKVFGGDDPAPEADAPVISEKDRRGLLADAAKHGLSKDDVKALAGELFSVDSTTKIPADRVDELRAAIVAHVEGQAA